MKADLGAHAFELPAELRAKLDAASATDLPFPHDMHVDAQQTRMRGGVAVGDKPAGDAPPVWIASTPAREIKASR